MAALNFASTKKGSTAAGSSSQKTVEGMIRSRCEKGLLDDGQTQLMVMEVACGDPGCVPIETVVILVAGGGSKRAGVEGEDDKSADGKYMARIFKPIAEVLDYEVSALALPTSNDPREFRIAAEKQKEIERVQMNKIMGVDESGEKSPANNEIDEKVEDKAEEKNEAKSSSNNTEEGGLVQVMVDDGWTGTRPMMVRRLPQRPKFANPDVNDGVPGKHKGGKAPTGCPCCDPDMFDLLMTKPPI